MVTGGGQGIGAGIVKRLAEAGAHVIIADRDLALATQTAEELNRAGYTAEAMPFDVTNHEHFLELEKAFESRDIAPDIWVNNAGAFPKKTVFELTVEDWDRAQHINTRSAFLGAQTAARLMKNADKHGVILNMASIAGVRLAPTNPVDYAAAKAGVAMLTRNLGVELGPIGIRVVGLAPGFVVTPGVRNTPRVNERIGNTASIPALGRQMVEDDVAKVALFLVSDMASMISAEIVVVDGGGAWNLETRSEPKRSETTDGE